MRDNINDRDLLARREIQREWHSRLLALALELFSDNEVPIFVENQLIRERIEEQVVVKELVAPGHVEIDER